MSNDEYLNERGVKINVSVPSLDPKFSQKYNSKHAKPGLEGHDMSYLIKLI